jgi:hypothetical protein
MRLTLAILTAFIITSVLSTGVDHIFHITGIYPPYGEPMYDTGLLLLASTYRFVFQVIGSYVMAIVAEEKAMKAAWIMGTLGAIFWLAGAFFMKGLGPVWYPVLGALLTFPSVLLGVKFMLIAR